VLTAKLPFLTNQVPVMREFKPCEFQLHKN
jgi:hypothetical protein